VCVAGGDGMTGKGKAPRGSSALITAAATSTTSIPGDGQADRSGNYEDGINSRGLPEASATARVHGHGGTGSLRSPNPSESQSARFSSIVQASPTRALHPKRVAVSGTRQLQQQTTSTNTAASAAANATINGSSDSTLAMVSPSRPRSSMALTVTDSTSASSPPAERALALPLSTSSLNASLSSPEESGATASTSVRPVSRLSATIGSYGDRSVVDRPRATTRSVIATGSNDATNSNTITYNEPLQLTHQRPSTTALVVPSSSTSVIVSAEPTSLATIPQASSSSTAVVSVESVEDVVAARYAARKAAAAIASGRPYVPPVRTRAIAAPRESPTPATAPVVSSSTPNQMSFSRSLPVALSPNIDALLRPTLANGMPPASPNGKKEAEIAPAFVPKRRPYSARASPRRSESPFGGQRRMMESASTTHMNMMRSTSPAVLSTGMHTPTGGSTSAYDAHKPTWFGNSVPTDRGTPVMVRCLFFFVLAFVTLHG
jgi:hypothetical protein